MAFFNTTEGSGFYAGHFLANPEECVRESMMVNANHGQKIVVNGRTIVPAGAVIPANGSTAKGILYEDVDVTNGDAWGSVVTAGVVYTNLLPAAISGSANLSAITTATAPTVTRPDFFEREFGSLTVESVEGTAVGDTAITVSGYTMEQTDSYKYKVADAATAVVLGEPLPSGFTAWDGDDDITAATDKVITVVVVSAGGYVLAAGSDTVTAKA